MISPVAGRSLDVTLVVIVFFTFVTCDQTPTSKKRPPGGELCQSEYFTASCEENEVIVMKKAMYGRMSINRCVKENFGYVGCSRDVLEHLDSLCSGRKSCKVRVLDETFNGIKPCHDDLKSYLYAEYSCVKVFTRDRSLCRYYKPLELTAQQGYVGSIVAEETGCGSADAPWIIRMEEGQKISVTLYDFALKIINSSSTDVASGTPNSKICRVYATIREATNTRSITVCGGNNRVRHVYTSVTNQIELRILNSKTPHDPLYFLFKYEAVGCPSITPPVNGWIKQTGHNAYIGCENIPTTWRLYCNGTSWVGDRGNCTVTEKTPDAQTDKKVDFGIASLSMDLSIILVITMALAIGLLILLAGLYCMRRQFSSDPNDPPSPNHYKATPMNTTTRVYYPDLQKSSRPDLTSVPLAPCRECSFKENEYASMRLLSLYDQENHSNLNKDSTSSRCPTHEGQGNTFGGAAVLGQYKPTEQCASCSIADSGISSECCCHQYFDFDPESATAQTLKKNTANQPGVGQSTFRSPALKGRQTDHGAITTMDDKSITSKSLDSIAGAGPLKIHSSQCS